MSFGCLVCHCVGNPSHSLRTYSVSSSENDDRCSAIANCLGRKPLLPLPSVKASAAHSSKVTPYPTIPSSSGVPGTARLVRSQAVRRDNVRDWNFEGVVIVQ